MTNLTLDDKLKQLTPQSEQYNDAQMLMQWDKLAQTITETQIRQAMLSNKPLRKLGDTWILYLPNKTTISVFQDYNTKLLYDLRIALKNTNIKFEYSIDENRPTVDYSDSALILKWRESYPNISAIIDILDLKI